MSPDFVWTLMTVVNGCGEGLGNVMLTVLSQHAGMWIGGRTQLLVFRQGNMNAQRYLNDIIRQHVIPQAQRFGNGFLFMDDNAPCHRARVVRNELAHHNVASLDWPARSPDLNPIEQAWDILGRGIASLPVRPHTLEALENALVQQWDAIPQASLDGLITSMPRRLQACLDAHGAHTRY